MNMAKVLEVVNRAAENEEKELTLLTEIKASNDELRRMLEDALDGDNVSADLEAAINHLDAENTKVEDRIGELGGDTGTGSTGTSGDGTGSGGIAPSGDGDGTSEPGDGTSEPGEPALGASEPPTSGTL